MNDVVAATERLVLRRLTRHDAEFIRELVNEPGWIRYIGDRNVRTTADAENYLLHGPLASYERFGFGLNLVSLKDGPAVGMCGLIKRDGLEDVDLGFALLERYAGRGYATEAAQAIMRVARDEMGIRQLVAITQDDNGASIHLLRKLGFAAAGRIRLRSDGAELLLHRAAL